MAQLGGQVIAPALAAARGDADDHGEGGSAHGDDAHQRVRVGVRARQRLGAGGESLPALERAMQDEDWIGIDHSPPPDANITSALAAARSKLPMSVVVSGLPRPRPSSRSR